MDPGWASFNWDKSDGTGHCLGPTRLFPGLDVPCIAFCELGSVCYKLGVPPPLLRLHRFVETDHRTREHTCTYRLTAKIKRNGLTGVMGKARQMEGAKFVPPLFPSIQSAAAPRPRPWLYIEILSGSHHWSVMTVGSQCGFWPLSPPWVHR